MPERIYKLQPDRTMALRGFDDLGASAALHSATPAGFKVSGVFRDAADFAVLLLWDADNFYEHPRLRYLPDMNFAGLTLRFDVHYSGLMPLESRKFATIDWPFLDVIRADGTKAQVRLADHAVQVGGTLRAAECSFTIEDNGLKEFDRLTIWYENLAFDYLVPKVECAFAFTAGGAGTQHTVRVAGTSYTYIEASGDTNTSVANGVAAALSASAHVSAVASSGQVDIRAKKDDGAKFFVEHGTTVFELHGVGASAVAAALAAQVNASNWGGALPLAARSDGASLRFDTAAVPGQDGNFLTLQAVAKNSRLKTSAKLASFGGGVSDAVWRITLDFSSLGLQNVRQMWLTFAPPLAVAAPLESTEWEATFTNWSVTGPEEARRLSVAGPLSVRVEETDRWCQFSGSWTTVNGFYSDGSARKTVSAGSAVEIRYACSSVHDLYLGTTLGRACGSVQVRVVGGATSALDCWLDSDAPVNTRRRVRTAIPPGEHTVVITTTSNEEFYFDFLEAVVAADVPDPLPANTRVSPALDYSTDHTYKLPPARIHWNFDRLGFAAPMNEYIGVFWWNQRRRAGGAMPEARIEFSGTYVADDALFLKIGEGVFEFGKSVFPADTPETIAQHYANFLNGYSVGVWARTEGNALIITSRSAKPAWRFPLSLRKQAAPGSTGTWTITGSLETGDPGTWVIDPEQTPALNRGAREWHADMFRECQTRNREITVAASMELVNPPDGFAATFPDGRPVVTDIGFGQLKSTHCHFGAAMRAYQTSMFKCVADLQAAAGLIPSVQFGEFLWWFFTNKTEANPSGGMAFYDSETEAAAQAALGRPLQRFRSPVDDPSVNSSADAAFLRNRLRDHVAGLAASLRAAHQGIQCEVLFPYDVNHPEPAGIHLLGGKLNRFVNLPVEWERKETAGFDRLKTEALDFGAWCRNLDLAKTAFLFSTSLGWEKESLRHLVPIFRPGYAWEKEVEMALAAGIPVVNLWAWDHIGLFGLAVLPVAKGRSAQSD